METKKNKLTDIILINNLNDYLRRGVHNNSEKCFGLTVTNITNKEVKRTLFAASEYRESSLKNINTFYDTAPYKLILRNLLSNTIYVNKIRVSSSNFDAVKKVITLGDKSIYAESIGIPIRAEQYLSACQIQKGIIDIDFDVNIGANTSLDIIVPAKTAISYVFFTSKLLEFTSKYLPYHGHSKFITTCSELLTSSDYILKKYGENPYLHSGVEMIPYLDKIQNKINQWINDKTFKYSFHKNVIEIYDILNPFVAKYRKVVDDAEPLFIEYRKANYESYLADEAKENKKAAKSKIKKATTKTKRK